MGDGGWLIESSSSAALFDVVGVGGYDGYYTTGFLEEFRFLVDRRLEDHVFLPDGATSVCTSDQEKYLKL